MKTQSQKIMLFILTMSVYGIATLFSELVPKFYIGIVEFSIEYLLFIPLTLAMLFEPLPVALGAATGELIFSEIMLGKFGGIGEFEKFITVTIGVYIAGRMVKNPKNKKMIGIAVFTGVFIQLLLDYIIDVIMVNLALDDFDLIAGLPESVVFCKGFELINDLAFSGVVFCLLPTLYFVPKLYGKIEPLMGIKPRDEYTVFGNEKVFSVKVIVGCIVGVILAIGVKLIQLKGYELINLEADWSENVLSYSVAFATAIVIFIIVMLLLKKKSLNTKEANQ